MSTRRKFLSWLAGGTFGVATAAGPVSTWLGALPAAAEAAVDDDPENITVIVNATLIDGTGAPPRPNTVLVLVGERIVAVGRHPVVPSHPDLTVVDAGGRFVLPGLWDMHTHGSWLYNTFLPLHVVHGVTGIREMVGPPGMQEIRDLVDAGELLGPRMVLASELVDGPHSAWGSGEGIVQVRTEAEARAAVRRAKKDGADFVKVYSFLFPDTYAAIADEAHRLGITFAGHVPHQMPVQDAVELGQHTLEHQYGMLISTSRRRDQHYREIQAVFADENRADEWGPALGLAEHEAITTHHPALARQLYRRMVRQGSWVSPTIGVERLFGLPPQELLDDERLRELTERYIHPFMRTEWRDRARDRLDWPPEQIARFRAVSEARSRMVGEMADAGVGIVAGTDCWIHFIFPGISLHDELELLVRNGLSPMRALQAATRDAARCLGREQDSGTVSPGKLADLVILDADPLADIGNIRTVHAVVSRGRYISPRERQRILDDVEAAAQEDPDGEEASALLPGTGSCCP